MTKKIEIGDLVRWYEYYAEIENTDLVRVGGVGVVLENTTPVTGAIRSVNYRVKVFCTKKRLARWFSIREIDLIKKGVYKPNQYIKKEI